MPASFPRWRGAARISSARWLEHDGDSRPPAEVAKASAFRCDSHGCTARVKGALLAVAGSPAALRDDCTAAAILVIKFARPKGCAPRGPAIDTEDLSTRGAHALRIDGGQIRIETVADTRGNRPWAPQLRRGDHHPTDPGDDDWPARGRP